MPEATTGFRFEPIGFVENEFKESRYDPEEFAGTLSRINVLDRYAGGLYRIEGFGRLYVLFLFDRSEGYDLVLHPRGDPERPVRGVFATHSPRRPNPIGLTVVELVGVEGNVVIVRGLDAVDGTPVLDIKPADR